MKYDLTEFNSAVSAYKKLLGNVNGKDFLFVMDAGSQVAFYSIAPLSRAVHELGADMSIICSNRKLESFDAIKGVWAAFESGSGDIHKSLTDFISEVDKKCNGEFKNIFNKPDFIFTFNKSAGNFEDSFSKLSLPSNDKWFKPYRMEELKKTMKIIWKDVYNIKKKERIGLGFPLIARQELLGHPLEDYLDSYSIIWASMDTANELGEIIVSSSTQRESMLENPERVSELRATLMGCELERDIDDVIFSKYKRVSKLLRLDRIRPVDATFFVSGKGYAGKHLFGERIGYPTQDKKSRWQSPGQMIYKLDFYPQSKFESRDPMARVGFTETVPIDIFIETSLVDWADIRNRNQRLKDVMDKCDVIYVEGNLKEKYTTKLEVGLVKKDGIRRWVRRSDTDVREKLNLDYLKMTGIRAGNMANIPGGEAFVTPEYIKGIFVGDVVIHVDQSYVLNEKNPIVVECFGDHYKIKDGPKDIISKVNKRKKEAMDLLLQAEKHKSLPSDIIELKKKNFERIGEFAINTNPKARLCDYLIVNEKIAKMMHIAMGSGFEPDRSTEYHMDIVFNAPRQKLDVYGVDKQGNEHWILRNGEFVF